MPSQNTTTSRPERWRNLSQTILLLAIWLLLSGHYTPLLLSFGAASVALVIWIGSRMNLVDHEGHPVQLTLRFPVFVVWLLKEIIVSNIAVTKMILMPRKYPLLPAVGTLDSSSLGDVGQVIYANSITLTPGTVTIDIQAPNPNMPSQSQQSRLQVHALIAESVTELKAGGMAAQVKKLAGNH